jgi:septum site-determining protein MinC
MLPDSPLPIPSDSAESVDLTSIERPFLDHKLQAALNLKTEGDKLQLILPAEADCKLRSEWEVVEQELKHRLYHDRAKWSDDTAIEVIAQDQLLDGRQLQSIERIFKEAKLRFQCVHTHRRQTAVAAATAGYSVIQQSFIQAKVVDRQKNNKPPLAEPLYLETTVRSGVEIRHSGNVVIVGDLNPSGTVIATGDIIVWGRLRGVAHAGAQGDRSRRIMALRIEPSQLRIADLLARVSAKPKDKLEAEVAYVTIDGIRIDNTLDFARTYSFSELAGGWQRDN